ncbi:hypothetical protein [Lactococcus garvieae]|uniref:hypothetical protein n=2 Tax=Lactococcus TaxID=1357 RepID=UPI00254C6884|nr:hypothetical protein [Lactococcus garvieae]
MKRKNLLKQASKKFVEGEDCNDMLIVLAHERSAGAAGKHIDYSNIKTQAQWDKAKKEAGFSPKPFKRVFDIWLSGDNYEEDCRIWFHIKENLIL